MLPLSLGLHSVVSGTLNIDPRHSIYVIAVLILRVTALGGGNSCAVYHTFARRNALVYRHRWCRDSDLWYTAFACPQMPLTTGVQLAWTV
jgi:hypothetical protein